MAHTKSLRTALALIIATSGLVLLAPSPAQAAPSTLTLGGPITPAVTYDSIVFQGQLSAGSGIKKAVLQEQVPGGWHDIGAWEPFPNGSIEAPFFTTTAGTYHLRLRSPGGSVISNVVEVEVVRHPTQVYAGVRTNGTDVFVGQKLWVTGSIVEPTATPRVVVQRLVNGKWSDRAAGPVNAKGEFAIAITPTQVGRYQLRVRTNGGSKWSQYPMDFDVQPKPIPVPAS